MSPSDLSPLLQQRLPIGHQQLSVFQLLPRCVLQGVLVAQGHLVRRRHVHQAAGLVLAAAERPVHHLVEAEQRLRFPTARGGRGAAGRHVVVEDIVHQVHQVGGLGGGLGGVGRRGGASVPQVDQAVCARLSHGGAEGGGGVPGLRRHALHRLGGLLLRLRTQTCCWTANIAIG